MDAAVDAIIIIDAKGEIQTFNKSAQQMFGYSEKEALNRNVSLLMPEPHRSSHDGFLRNYMNTGKAAIIGIGREVAGLKKSGEIFPILLSVGEAKYADSFRFVGIIRDISDRKRFERELEAARHEAEVASRAKSQFLANMSHEIRTPLNAIINLYSLLLDTTLSPEQNKLVQAANEGGKALSTLVDDILDFSKIEAGELKLLNHPFNLHELIHDLGSLFRPQAESAGLEFNTHLASGVPEWVNADEARLRQVLFNLIGNGLKFTESGSVGVTVEACGDGVYLFRVDDTGIGISPEDAAFIFAEFSQADGSLTRRHGGTGLGLTISRKLGRMMGGEIGYEPRPEGGSSFWMQIPLAAAARAGKNERAGRKGASIFARVLVAEDSRSNQIVARALLEKAGCNVQIVNNGEEAVEAVRDDVFDMVFMDISMPVMDGLQATQMIRSMQGESSRVPIVAMTANVFSEDRDKCLQAGMNDFISKPVHVKSLLDQLTHWLSPTDTPAVQSRQKQAGGESRSDVVLMDSQELSKMEEETSRELMTHVIGIFIKEVKENLASLQEAAGQADPVAMAERAHAIKSSSGTFGALRLHDAASRVEELGREGNGDGAAEAISAVVDTANETLPLYAEFFSGAAKNGSTAPNPEAT